MTTHIDTHGAVDEGTGTNLSRPRVSMTVFFLVSFGIPWATWVALRMRHVAFPESTVPFMVAAAFCSAGGVVATYIANGRSGLRELAHRCVLYRVPVAWWLYALFLTLAVHVVATVIYGTVHGRVGPVRSVRWSCSTNGGCFTYSFSACFKGHWPRNLRGVVSYCRAS